MTYQILDEDRDSDSDTNTDVGIAVGADMSIEEMRYRPWIAYTIHKLP